MRKRCAPVSLALLLTLAGLVGALAPAPACAQELRLLLSGRSGSLRDGPGSQRDGAVLSVRADRELADLASPLCPARSSLQLAALTGTALVRQPLIALPCEGWRARSGGFSYRDAAASAGGVRQIRYTDRGLRIDLRGPGYAALAGPVGFVQAELRVGGERRVLRLQNLARNEEDRIASRPARRAASEGEAAFWDTLWGVADRAAEAIALLERAGDRDPSDGRSRFLLGMLHLYRFSQAVVDWNDVGPFARAEIGRAKAALEAAEPLLWDGERGDNRVPGFVAAATYQHGFVHGDVEEMALGIQLLEEAVALNPFFNNFDFFAVAPTVPPDDPYYQRVVQLVDEAFFGSAASCVVTQPEFCANAGMAPHNLEGSLLLFGDIYAKAGRREDARSLYELLAAVASRDWEFRNLALQRSANVDQRVDLYLNADPSDDPPLVGVGAEACATCHHR